jgi:hypothetical protein
MQRTRRPLPSSARNRFRGAMAACRRQAHSPCTRQSHFLFPSQPCFAGPWRSMPHGLRWHVGRCWKPRFARPWQSAPTWLPPTCGLMLAAASSCPTPTTRALRRAHRDRAHTRGRHGAHLNAFQDNVNLAFLLGEQGSASYHTSPRLGVRRGMAPGRWTVGTPSWVMRRWRHSPRRPPVCGRLMLRPGSSLHPRRQVARQGPSRTPWMRMHGSWLRGTISGSYHVQVSLMVFHILEFRIF